MAYLLDALVILIVVLCVRRGWKNGLIRTLVMLVGFVVTAFVAGQLSSPIAAGVYDGMIGPNLEDAVVESAVAAGESQVDVSISTLFGESETLEGYFKNLGLATSASVRLDDLSEETVRAAVKPAMQQVLRPAMVHMLSAITTVLLFFLLIVVFKLASRLLDTVFKLPVLKQLNQFGGLAAGVLQGVFWATVVAVLVQFLAKCGAFGSVLTVQAVEQTWVTARLANWNWIFAGKV